MNREALKELGLSEEQIEAVMKSHGTTVNATKQELDTVTTDRDNLKGQLTDRDAQLDALSGIDADGLKAEIERLKGENATVASDYQARLDKQALSHSTLLGVTTAGARNTKAVMALLDSEIIKLGEDGNVIGLSEQIEALKASDGYLFADAAPVVEPVTPSGYSPGSRQRTNTPGTVDPKEAGRLKALERHKREE